MWSGPRNISTAMMRGWENRPDTYVIDEPFYAHYLAHTGIDHPMAADIIADGEIDWRQVVDHITTPPADGIFYQKHITTHLLPHIELDFVDALSHVFLIRDPRAVVASYSRKREAVTATDLGYEQQLALFERVHELRDEAPPVIDSALFLHDPRGQLEALCSRLAIDFDPAMLQWPAGERDSDGIWHRHWYDAVKVSTTFQRPSDLASQNDADKSDDNDIAAACRLAYEKLRLFAIQTG